MEILECDMCYKVIGHYGMDSIGTTHQWISGVYCPECYGSEFRALVQKAHSSAFKVRADDGEGWHNPGEREATMDDLRDAFFKLLDENEAMIFERNTGNRGIDRDWRGNADDSPAIDNMRLRYLIESFRYKDRYCLDGSGKHDFEAWTEWEDGGMLCKYADDSRKLPDGSPMEWIHCSPSIAANSDYFNNEKYSVVHPCFASERFCKKCESRQRKTRNNRDGVETNPAEMGDLKEDLEAWRNKTLKWGKWPWS